MMLHGIGLYPQDKCYDANRPTWLPYWLNDTLEGACLQAPADVGGAGQPSDIGDWLMQEIFGNNSSQTVTPPASVIAPPSVPSQALTTPATPCGLDASGNPIPADQCAQSISNQQIAQTQANTQQFIQSQPVSCSAWQGISCNAACPAGSLPFYCGWNLPVMDIALLALAGGYAFYIMTRR